MDGLTFRSTAPDEVVEFESTSATLDPVVVAAGAEKILWRWADGTTSTGANPGSKDMSGTDGKHRLLVRDFSDVTELNSSTDGITAFSGLGLLTSLTHLNLYNNSLVDIGDVTELTSLTYLNLAVNSLVDIGEVTPLTSLTYMSLNSNSLVDIGEVTLLTSLTYLNLYNNSLADIGDVTELTSLTYLNLAINSLEDIGRLNTQQSLTTIYLQTNSFDALLVDRALCDVAESVAAHARTGTMNISGNTAPTDGAVTGFDGVQAKADLIAAGWTVTTD